MFVVSKQPASRLVANLTGNKWQCPSNDITLARQKKEKSVQTCLENKVSKILAFFHVLDLQRKYDKISVKR